MSKSKIIILSAYACEPNKGSEPGIGWLWALELAKLGHQVKVITRYNNKDNIEKGINRQSTITNLEFFYYDLPKWLQIIKKSFFGIYFYYFFWQIGILKTANKIHKKHKADLIHHITFGVFRQPSFLWLLNIPFVFGPVGGAEMTPHKLLKTLPLSQYLKELFRVFINYAYKFSPILNLMYAKTDLILCKTEDTSRFLPKYLKSKTYVAMEIGIKKVNYNEKEDDNNDILRVLYVGRFLGWKGIHLGLEAVKKANNNCSKIEFTLIGKGPFENSLKIKAKQDSSIRFINWVTQEELFNYYSSFDCLLFPSFHDSSGNVILEAFSFGLPVISLNLGGPNKLVNETCGFIIRQENKTVSEITDEIAQLLNNLQKNKSVLLTPLRKGAFEQAEYYKIEKTVERTYSLIQDKLNRID